MRDVGVDPPLAATRTDVRGQSVPDRTTDDPDFNLHTLRTYLLRQVPGLQGEMRLERIGGGQSNPTFFVTFDNRRLVLRKQPGGQNLLPLAHAVDREYRIMTALAQTAVPVPRTVHYCEDRLVIGTPFYVMDRIDGRIFGRSSLPEVTIADRGMVLAMAETLAAVHKVDWAAVGLSDYGRPGNYFQRQVALWTRQWQMSKTHDSADIEHLIRWLPDHVPSGEETTIAHGDFRLGNLMFHPIEPRVVGVLDWELSTLGHPLADLACSCIMWHMAPSEFDGVRGLDIEALGLPAQGEYIARYLERSGCHDTIGPFHMAFSLFRFAVILEGIAARAQRGVAASGDAAVVGTQASAFARRAMMIAQGEVPAVVPG